MIKVEPIVQGGADFLIPYELQNRMMSRTKDIEQDIQDKVKFRKVLNKLYRNGSDFDAYHAISAEIDNLEAEYVFLLTLKKNKFIINICNMNDEERSRLFDIGINPISLDSYVNNKVEK